MSVSEKKGGYFVGKYKDANGSWKDKSVPKGEVSTKQEAEAWFAKWLREESTKPPPGEKKTLNLLKDKWLAYHKENEVMHSQFNSHAKKHFGMIADWNLEKDFTIPKCREFLRSLVGAPYTRRNIHQSIRNFFHTSIAEGWINLAVNPFEQKTVGEILKAPKTKADDVIFLNKGQIEKLLNCETLDLDRRVKYRVALLTGLRLGELQALTWGNYKKDEETGVPYLEVVRQITKPGKVGEAKFKLPKKGKKRNVPLHSLAVEALEFYRAIINPTLLEPIFGNKEKEFIYNNSALNFRKDLGRAGVETHFGEFPFTFHATRRSFITIMEKFKISEERRYKIAGHAGRGIQAKSYLGGDLKELAESIETIKINVAPMKKMKEGLKLVR